MEDNNNLTPEEGEQNESAKENLDAIASDSSDVSGEVPANEDEKAPVVEENNSETISVDEKSDAAVVEVDGMNDAGCSCDCSICEGCNKKQKMSEDAVKADMGDMGSAGCGCDCEVCQNCTMDEACKKPNESISPVEAAEASYEILSTGFENAEDTQKVLETAIEPIFEEIYKIDESTVNEEKLTFQSQILEKKADNKWAIRVIKAGWSLNGRYYPAEMLKEDKGKFEKRPIAIYGWFPESRNLGHVPTSVRNSVPGLVLNEVGWVENVESETENGRLQLIGDFICTDDILENRLNNIWNINKSQMPGFSIDAVGDVAIGEAEGRRGLIVKSITYSNEVTLVTRPAAGGNFRDKLVASFDEDFLSEIETVIEQENLENSNDRREQMDEKDNNVQENEALLDDIKNLKEEMAKAMKEIEESRKAARLAECKALLATKLKESGFNDKACSMIRVQFEGREFTEAELDARIGDIRELLASVDGGGVAQVAQPRFSHVSDPKERMEAALELCFGFDYNKESGLSEAQKDMYRSITKPSFLEVYKNWCDDSDLSFRVGPNALQEQLSSDLPTSMGNTLGRVVVQQYKALPELWRPFVTVNPNVDNLKAQTRIFHSGLGSLNTVVESTAADQYSQIGDFVEDSIQYTITQRGGLYTITRQMLINDDLNTLQKLPKKMARLASKELHEFVFGMLIGNKGGAGIGTDNAYDGVDFYHANHFNLGSSAFNHASLLAAMNALGSMYEYGVRTTVTDNPLSSGATTINLGSTTGMKAGQILVIEAEKIQIGAVASATQLTGCTRGVLGTTAASHASTTRVDQMHAPLDLLNYHLIYPAGTDVAEAVFRVLNTERKTGGSTWDKSMFDNNMNGTIIPHAIPVTYLGNDPNNWYLTAMPDQIDVFELAFLFNRQVPETWLQDNPIVGNVFLRDNFTYKLRHEYNGTCLDWRGAYASIVA